MLGVTLVLSSLRVIIVAAALALLVAVGWQATGRAQPVSWAFEETFDGQPASPSHALLPKTFDYVVTHRTHPSTPDGRDGSGSDGSFPADHGPDCAPPDAQHRVAETTHRSNTAAPDASFYVCRDHMMTALGEVDGYSVSTFYPRQEFDFSAGGALEWDVDLHTPHARVWWEVLITPRESLQLGAAMDWLPIDETYPEKRIVLVFLDDSKRQMHVGTGATPPGGVVASATDWAGWAVRHTGDPALSDRRIRRRMRVEPTSSHVRWLGANTLRWTVGPRPPCAALQWFWDGFAVKAVELQIDRESGRIPAPPTGLRFVAPF